MEYVGLFLVALIAGRVGGMLVDAKFWWSFAQELYYHHPGNHPCKRKGCCR